MKTYQIRFKWRIEKDEDHGIFQTGESILRTTAMDITDAVNQAIEFANHIPSIDITGNGIDLDRYMDGCQVCYKTHIDKIERIVVLGKNNG